MTKINHEIRFDLRKKEKKAINFFFIGPEFSGVRIRRPEPRRALIQPRVLCSEPQAHLRRPNNLRLRPTQFHRLAHPTLLPIPIHQSKNKSNLLQIKQIQIIIEK